MVAVEKRNTIDSSLSHLGDELRVAQENRDLNRRQEVSQEMMKSLEEQVNVLEELMRIYATTTVPDVDGTHRFAKSSISKRHYEQASAVEGYSSYLESCLSYLSEKREDVEDEIQQLEKALARKREKLTAIHNLEEEYRLRQANKNTTLDPWRHWLAAMKQLEVSMDESFSLLAKSASVSAVELERSGTLAAQELPVAIEKLISSIDVACSFFLRFFFFCEPLVTFLSCTDRCGDTRSTHPRFQALYRSRFGRDARLGTRLYGRRAQASARACA